MHSFISLATRVGLFAAIAVVLSFWQFPVLFMPSFLTLDISDVPVLIGGLLNGWHTALAIAAVKNILRLFASGSFGIGELANFTLSMTYVTVALTLRRCGWYAYLAATVALAAVAVLLNFTVLFPLYQTAFRISTEQLLALTRAAGNQVVTVWDLMWWVIVPFNLIKGALVALVALPIYRRLRVPFGQS